MAEASYFSVVTSEASFESRFAAEEGHRFSEMHDVAASEWGREHLFACRVVRRGTQSNVLPVLSQFASRSDLRSPTEITKFLDGPAQTDMAESEHRLVRKYGATIGQIWSAMAMFKGTPKRRGADRVDCRDENGDQDEARPERDRRTTRQDCYVDSGMMRVGSSRPLAEDSDGPSSVGYVDAESHKLLALPEDETLRLASCVIRHILYFGRPQGSESMIRVVEFRDSKTRLATTTPVLERMITATDDGGLSLRVKDGDGFELTKNHVGILEAKGRFQCIDDGKPVISDRCFAQMTCEALVARLADPFKEFVHESVILINATQHYMCFLQFEISQEYLDDFESDEPRSFLYVNSTPWFDLSSKTGRGHVVSNICGMMRWAKES
ncbi:Uncharacterized protein TPAR_04545 [Tolypocladium paradoxum]|uniref:Uncharacterized protein n=1 Tax=Tolypocladium paradoxum TaxID=94208 RepID=A0A2S4KYJ4_9HYPO|nr:Uncharacterized protein TPAR_04545 [Tolypocladium paradoxum]